MIRMFTDPKKRIFLCTIPLVVFHLVPAFHYLFIFQGYLDHFEPSVTMGALRVIYGQQAFHGLDVAEHYSSLYGPTIYLWNALFIGCGGIGEAIFYSKLSGFTSLVLSLISIALFFRQRFGTVVMWPLLGYFSATCLLFSHYSYWNRPDSLLLLCVSLGLWGMPHSPLPKVVRAILLGTVLGICMNLKVHMCLCFFPIYLLLLYHRSFGIIFSSGMLALGILIMPFFWENLFSFENYWLRLQLASQHTLIGDLFLKNISYMLLLLSPSLLLLASIKIGRNLNLWTEENREASLLLGGLLFSMLPVTVVASKEGAGAHHLLPFIPLIAFLAGNYLKSYFTSSSEKKSEDIYKPLWRVYCPLLWLLFLFAFFSFYKSFVIVAYISPTQKNAIRELREIKNSYPPTTRIQMGYADLYTYMLTFLRPALASPQNTDIICAPALMDMVEAGITLKEPALDLLRSKKIDLWLLPQREEPFMLQSSYQSKTLIFTEEFRKTFFEKYQLVKEGTLFNIWQAKP